MTLISSFSMYDLLKKKINKKKEKVLYTFTFWELLGLEKRLVVI